MREYNQNIGRRWFDADVRRLAERVAHNAPTSVIGPKLGRTEADAGNGIKFL